MEDQELVKDIIRTKQLEFVDEEGCVRGTLRLNPADSDPQLTFSGKHGEGSVVIGFDGLGAHISILDDEGKGVINLRSFKDGRCGIAVSQGKEVVFSTGIDINGEPFLHTP